MNNTIITLFSSNATVQYVKDVFSVLSLPRGSLFQFRYQHNYLDPRTMAFFSNSSKKMNSRALVVFKSKYNSPVDNSFCIPIRWVRIKSISQIPNGYAVYFELDGYPKLTSEFRNQSATFQGLNQNAQSIFQQMGNNDYSVWGESLSIVSLEDEPRRDGENWLEIVRKLALVPGYNDYHFLKCSPFYIDELDFNTGNHQKVNCAKNQHLTEFVEGRCVNVDIEYYSANYNSSKKRQVELLVDSNVLSKSKGLRTTLQSRYGTIKIGLQSKIVANHTISEVIVSTVSSAVDELGTELVFPIVVVKNKASKLVKAIITGVGALLVALPGIIGDSLDVGWNILIAIAGALVLGINNYRESKE